MARLQRRPMRCEPHRRVASVSEARAGDALAGGLGARGAASRLQIPPKIATAARASLFHTQSSVERALCCRRITSRIRQIACDGFIVFWEKLSTGGGTKTVQGLKKQHFRLDILTSQGMLETYVAGNEQFTQKRTGGIPAFNKRTSRRRLQTHAADNQQLMHKGTWEMPALDKRLAVA